MPLQYEKHQSMYFKFTICTYNNNVAENVKSGGFLRFSFLERQ